MVAAERRERVVSAGAGPLTRVPPWSYALLAMLSLMVISWGYGRAEAQALLPIEYTAFIWAAIMGWAMFGEALTLPTIAGVALIVIGCWIAAPRKAHIEQTAL